MITRRMLTSCAMVAGAVACNATFLPAAHSEYKHCGAISLARARSTLTVVVNDLLQLNDKDPDALTARDWTDIEERLKVRINAMRGSGPYRFQVIRCPESKPALPEIGDQRVVDLNADNVIALIWGNAGGSKIRLTQIVVPSHMDDIRPDPTTFRVRKNLVSKDLLSVFAEENPSTLAFDAYFALGVGVKALNNEEIGVAQSYLCMALGKFKRVDGVPSNVRPYIIGKLKETAVKQSQDVASSKGKATMSPGASELESRLADPEAIARDCEKKAK